MTSRNRTTTISLAQGRVRLAVGVGDADVKNEMGIQKLPEISRQCPPRPDERLANVVRRLDSVDFCDRGKYPKEPLCLQLATVYSRGSVDGAAFLPLKICTGRQVEDTATHLSNPSNVT